MNDFLVENLRLWKRYNKIDIVGQGGYGLVVKGTRKFSPVTLKIIRIQDWSVFDTNFAKSRQKIIEDEDCRNFYHDLLKGTPMGSGYKQVLQSIKEWKRFGRNHGDSSYVLYNSFWMECLSIEGKIHVLLLIDMECEAMKLEGYLQKVSKNPRELVKALFNMTKTLNAMHKAEFFPNDISVLGNGDRPELIYQHKHGAVSCDYLQRWECEESSQTPKPRRPMLSKQEKALRHRKHFKSNVVKLFLEKLEAGGVKGAEAFKKAVEKVDEYDEDYLTNLMETIETEAEEHLEVSFVQILDTGILSAFNELDGKLKKQELDAKIKKQEQDAINEEQDAKIEELSAELSTRNEFFVRMFETLCNKIEKTETETDSESEAESSMSMKEVRDTLKRMRGGNKK